MINGPITIGGLSNPSNLSKPKSKFVNHVWDEARRASDERA